MRRLFPVLLFVACATGASTAGASDHDPAPIPAVGPGQAAAVFAGGCFWCMESDFDKLPGVVATTSGYAGGHTVDPTYEDVSRENTGHKESVRVLYDTSKLTYEQVVDWFWHHIDPTDGGGGFCDRGDSYRSAIYPLDDAQLSAALASKAALEAAKVLPGPIATEIVHIDTFYAAEIYHQDYHDTNPARYQPYRLGCGRDARVAELWSGH
jgi:peptide-methionine (S)-S-oxide reductase